MRRIICLLLVLICCIGFCACQAQKPAETQPQETKPVEVYTFTGTIMEVHDDYLVSREYNEDKTFTLVHIKTNDTKEYCVYDMLHVKYTQRIEPEKEGDPIVIIAQSITTEPLYCDKPIIYFYPEVDTECSVRLNLNGKLTCTYPAYDNEWKFTAKPDGTLVFPDGKEYYALYWEGTSTAMWDFSKGFCVKGEDTAKFLEWALAAQGLNNREINEFIVYWLPLMQENPYNVISFQSDIYTSIAQLNITPAPDNMIRVFMAYYPVEEPVKIEAQEFTPFERTGFTVVEWGGSKMQ